MQLLDVWQNERFPDSFSQPVTKPDGYYKKRLGALRAKGVIDNPGPYPVRYRWQESLALLEELNAAGESDPYDGVIADYVDPQTGGFTTASLHCRIQMLRPSEETESHRHSCNTVYHVARGAGVTKIGKSRTDGNGLDWAERDCFNVPTNYWHRFKNNSSKDPAILFSVSDRPLFEALRLYREEA